MTEAIDLNALLAESMQQAAARKLPRNIGHIPKPPNVSQEVIDTALMLRQWDAKREWTHAKNIIVFTRQKCKCCGETSKTFDGMFHLYSNNRIASATKMEAVTVFELDKPKAVIYRDAFVPICHECADVQQDWPLQED